MSSVLISTIKGNITVKIREPVLISDLLIQSGIGINMPCGGKGICLKCKVRAEGKLSRLTAKEKEIFSSKELAEGFRLACMTYVSGDARIRLNSEILKQRIVSAGRMPDFEKNPSGKKFGIAFDIGTTTVAGYLYDLRSFNLIGERCAENPQRIFGADVLTRVGRALENGANALSQSITACLEKLAGEMCAAVKIPESEIDSAVITGNTAMLSLLTCTDVTGLSRAPFKAASLFGCSGKNIGFSIPSLPAADIYFPRCQSAFAGADIGCAVLSSGMTDKTENSLLLDIGTNGETALWCRGKLTCCSAAAGPVFEGAGIKCGMTAVPGAIDHVFIDEKKIGFTTVEKVHAKGICGSGIIDAAAVLVSCGIIDKTGAFVKGNRRFADNMCKVNGEPAFRFQDTGVVITQKDIREIQLAKSALNAGIMALMHEAGIGPDEIGVFYVAGGFGNYINADSAAAIGLFPAQLKNKTSVLGNAAGAGACMLLLNKELRDKQRRTADSAETYDLSVSGCFMEYYINGMTF